MTISQHSLNSAGELPVNNPFLDRISNGSIHNVGGSADLWKVQGNLGFISLLFENPVYKRTLYEVGLRPETAFGCALDYLFAPSISVQTYFSHEFRIMSSNLLKVGVQARLGDSYLRGGVHGSYAAASLSSVKHFFDCAQHMGDTFRVPGQSVVIFLMSDSLNVRTQAAESYGELLVTKLEEAGHIQLTSGDQQRQAMIHAAGEHWLFGMADYHVISNIGNYGKSAALRSRQWHSIYALSVQGGNGLVCDGAKAMDFSTLAGIAPFI